jgi:MSHA biogenesis protein MshP
MFLKQKFSCTTRQQGFLLPVAIFLLVIASGFVLLMNKSLTQTSNTFLLNIFSQQSVYASETGAQLAINQLLLPATNRQQTDQRCLDLSINQVFSAEDINQCRIVVSCRCRYNNAMACDTSESGHYSGSTGVDNSYYYLESTATCGSGVSRSIYTTELISKFP